MTFSTSSESALTRPRFSALTRAECIHGEWYHGGLLGRLLRKLLAYPAFRLS